jgi:putative NADH-flavin reductase
MTTRSVVIGAHGRTGSLIVDELLTVGHRVTATVRSHEQQ